MGGYNQKIGGGGFHHIAMNVADFEASVRFYSEGLGCTQKIAWGEVGKRAIMLDTGDGNCLELFETSPSGPKPEGTLLHFALRTSDCDAALNQAVAAGAEVTMPPTDVTINSNPPTPVRIAFCKGFDGEIIEFFQNKSEG